MEDVLHFNSKIHRLGSEKIDLLCNYYRSRAKLYQKMDVIKAAEASEYAVGIGGLSIFHSAALDHALSRPRGSRRGAMAPFLRRLLVEDQCGATVIELCFLTALVAVAIIGSLHTFSNQLNNTFFAVSTNVVIKP